MSAGHDRTDSARNAIPDVAANPAGSMQTGASAHPLRLAVVPNDFNAGLASALRTEHPDVDVRVWPDIGDGRGVAYASCGAPPADLFERLPDLEVVFSFAAGVDQIDFGRVPEAVTVARMVDDSLTRGMTEYAVAAVMAIHRDFIAYGAQQSRGLWQRQQQRRAEDRQVGILGLGVLGSAIGRQLAALGFRVAGWSRTAKRIEPITCFSGGDGLEHMLAQSDIVLSVLPATPQTRNLIDGRLLGLLPQGAGIVNMGRGQLVVEQDLLDALDSGHLAAAVLDVFQVEPLPAESALWQHPRVLITPHVASGVRPESAARTIIERARRHAAGMGVDYVVDRSNGY